MVESTLQLQQWSLRHSLPSQIHAVADFKKLEVAKLYTVPMDYSEYPRTDAIALTGATQLKWISQLVHFKATRYMLHIDGKHKLHHGKWMLVSIGTHDIALREGKGRGGIVHSYRPLVYMFVRQQETAESVKFLCDALNWLAETYFGEKLQPGCVAMDHSDGFRKGVLSVWPDTGDIPMLRIRYILIHVDTS